jgi:hypothetical protein
MAQDADKREQRETRTQTAVDTQGGNAVHAAAASTTSDFGSSPSRAAAVRPRLTMATAVWGDWHLDMHFNVNMPTLLAPGNLPALAEHCDMTYVIFTRAADVERIDNAPAIEALRRVMSVEIKLLTEADLKDPIAAHHKAWNLVTEAAAADGSLVLLMPPDVAWAENCFASVVKRLKRGERATFMTYLRAEGTSFVEALLERKPKGEIVNAVPAREMVELCVRSLHPLMAAYLRDSDYFPIHPEMILWAVPGEGFAVRVLAREMFVFDPGYFHLNYASLPAKRLNAGEASFLADSDELFAVSLAPLGKDAAWHINPRRADPIEIAGWWMTYDSPVNDFMAAHKIRWHFAEVTEAKWRAKERASDLFVRRTAAAREGMRIWQVARELECSMTALALALAVHTGPLVRAARGRGGAIVLLPSDAAFAGGTSLDYLLAPEGTTALTRLMRTHHVPDVGEAVEARDPLGVLLDGEERRELRSAHGTLLLQTRPDGSYEISGARVIGGPLRAGAHAVYVVDRFVEPAKSAA